MNLLELRTQVKLITQDLGLTDTQYDAYINRAYALACEMVQLPSLKRVGSIILSPLDDRVSLFGVGGTSTSFNGQVEQVYLTETSTPLCRLTNLSELMPKIMEATGNEVEYYCIEGNQFWYSARPLVDTYVNFIYMQAPQELIREGDVPEEIPDSLHYDLIVRGSCAFIWELIEDGTEQAKINSQFNRSLSFNKNNPESGISRLLEWISRSKSHKRYNYWDV